MTKPLSYTYHKKGFRHFLSEESQPPFYSRLKIAELILKDKGKNLILKIRIKRKYQFQKIMFKHIKSLDIWFAKYRDSNDLLILTKKEKGDSFSLDVYIEQWNYRTLIISSLIL